MCTNRALTDLYAFSARFIQLLNRKLAYVIYWIIQNADANIMKNLNIIIPIYGNQILMILMMIRQIYVL